MMETCFFLIIWICGNVKATWIVNVILVVTRVYILDCFTVKSYDINVQLVKSSRSIVLCNLYSSSLQVTSDI